MPEAQPKTPWIDVAEIKRSVSIEQVLSYYGLLDKMQRRGNSLRGLSPFRSETHPSFTANIERNVWNDFPRPSVDGKEVSGDVIGLVQGLEGNCSFRDALLKLNELTCGPPPKKTLPAAEQTRAKVGETLEEQKKDSRLDVQAATRPGASGPNLINEVFGKELKGLRYNVPFLQDRGLDKDRAKYWGCGYCSRGLMKGKVVIPIRNRAGEVVAYLGRSLKPDDSDGKYRFPLGVHKSLELFNVHNVANDPETQEAVAKYGLIVVEGVFDAIWLVEHGFKNTVAVLGSDVSPQQRAMLVDPELNPTRQVTIFFDNDEAGRAGRKKACGDIIYDGFVRYVDYSRVDVGDRTDPDHFTKEELAELLG